jgi:hypothetical protein
VPSKLANKRIRLIKQGEKYRIPNKNEIVTDCLQITINKINGTKKEMGILSSAHEVKKIICNKLTSKKVQLN